MESNSPHPMKLKGILTYIAEAKQVLYVRPHYITDPKLSQKPISRMTIMLIVNLEIWMRVVDLNISHRVIENGE